MIERRLPSAPVLVVALLLSAACIGNPEPAGGVKAAGARDDAWQARRLRMVESQLRSRDITDERVLEAMAKVPRHLFVPDDRRDAAYTDRPLPIGYGQTISQPYIVAYMTQALMLDARDRVLEIGTGSAYQAAILAELAGEVYSIEIVEALAVRARATLLALGYGNVQVRTGNGY
jgi:protein-L-isoaspartate(D-aspartate) O-methyltransferase